MNGANTPDLGRYTAALEQVRYEGQLLWQIFNAFLLAHTVFLAFLLQAGFGSGKAMVSCRPGVFVAGIVGVILCVPWMATYLRSSAYYIFRMAQAREAEPVAWNIIKGQGEAFSAGRSPVIVGEEAYGLPWLGRALRTKRSVPLLIVVFFLSYLSVIVVSGPWW
jgi:hypothetical protein